MTNEERTDRPTLVQAQLLACQRALGHYQVIMIVFWRANRTNGDNVAIVVRCKSIYWCCFGENNVVVVLFCCSPKLSKTFRTISFDRSSAVCMHARTASLERQRRHKKLPTFSKSYRSKLYQWLAIPCNVDRNALPAKLAIMPWMQRKHKSKLDTFSPISVEQRWFFAAIASWFGERHRAAVGVAKEDTQWSND